MTETTIVNGVKFFRSVHRVVRDRGYYSEYSERSAEIWVSAVDELIHGCYGWEVLADDDWGGREVTEFSTNHDGEGLWEGDRQMIGTCDFRLRGDRRRNRRVVLSPHIPAY